MMKVKKEFVNLDSHISNARKVKRLKAHKDRLLDALRDLTNATHNASSLTDEQKTALDKAVSALQYHHNDTLRHDSGL
jgi:hypothetical protein